MQEINDESRGQQKKISSDDTRGLILRQSLSKPLEALLSEAEKYTLNRLPRVWYKSEAHLISFSVVF